jgi:hypothetical protein
MDQCPQWRKLIHCKEEWRFWRQILTTKFPFCVLQSEFHTVLLWFRVTHDDVEIHWEKEAWHASTRHQQRGSHGAQPGMMVNSI